MSIKLLHVVLTEYVQLHGRLAYAVAHQFVGSAAGQSLAMILPCWGDGQHGGASVAILGDLQI